MNIDNALILREDQAVGRKTILMVAVGAFVGALAGGAMADILGESSQSEQVLLASVAQEFVLTGNPVRQTVAAIWEWTAKRQEATQSAAP